MDKQLKYERYGDNKDLYRSYEERHSKGAEKTKVVMKGTYKGRHFMIGASNLGYPVAYVEVLKKDSYIMNEREDWRADKIGCVDGSSNYFGGAYWDPADTRKYIGWDYGHLDDYMGHEPTDRWDPRDRDDGHKWTLAEILMEIAEAIMEIEYEGYIDKNFRYAPV